MRSLAILAALALSVNTASASISAAISVDGAEKRAYAVFYENEACSLASAWDCAYIAVVCYIPERRIGAILMHVRPETIRDTYSEGSISVNGGTPDPLLIVRPVRDTSTSWVVSTVAPSAVTASLNAALPIASTVEVTMGDYHRSVPVDDMGRGVLARVVEACR